MYIVYWIFMEWINAADYFVIYVSDLKLVCLEGWLDNA